jgi:hypothetical protein
MPLPIVLSLEPDIVRAEDAFKLLVGKESAGGPD